MATLPKNSFQRTQVRGGRGPGPLNSDSLASLISEMSKPTGTSGERRFWATSLVILGTLGLATGFYPVQGFWSSYTLDIVGPAWNYILIRGLFAKNQSTFLSKLFTPDLALSSIVSVCFLVETAQYFGL